MELWNLKDFSIVLNIRISRDTININIFQT